MYFQILLENGNLVVYLIVRGEDGKVLGSYGV